METIQQKYKRIVEEFYDARINKKDFEAGIKRVGKEYKQHNPAVADGLKGLREFFYWHNANFLYVHPLRRPGPF